MAPCCTSFGAPVPVAFFSIDTEGVPLEGQLPKAGTLGICPGPTQTWYSVSVPSRCVEWRLGSNLVPPCSGPQFPHL